MAAEHRPENRAENRDDPRAEYTRRLNDRSAELARRAEIDRRLASARGVTFLSGLVLAAAALWGGWPVWPVLAAVAVFVVLVVWHGRVLADLDRARRAVEWYRHGLERLDDQWAGRGPTGVRYRDPEHPYADDLDLFGDASLFQLVCRARTRLGEDMLAAWLLSPASIDVALARQAPVEELRGELDLREELALLDAEVHDELDQNRLREWAATAPKPLPPWPRIAAVILAAVTLAGFLAWFAFKQRITWFLAPLLAEIVLAVLLARRIRASHETVNAGTSGLRILSRVLRIVEDRRFTAPLLTTLHDRLHGGGGRPSGQIERLHRLAEWFDNSLQNQLFFPLAFVLGLPVHLTHAVERWKLEVGPHVADWLDAVGQFEALSSLAGYAYERPADPFPRFTAEGPLVDGHSLGHPLLPERQRVPNDLRLGGELRLILVSGSNMSGKSTLLRTVGVNVVLALAGAPVCAKAMTLSELQVATAMRIQDSLRDGRSLFYSVVRRLKSVVDLTDRPRPVLFLLDEILQGTNSHDRRVGSEGVIHRLIERGALGLVTTHDLALTEIAGSLGPAAANCHFEDHIEDGRMTFDYRVRPGVVQKSNALELMRMIGLDV